MALLFRRSMFCLLSFFAGLATAFEITPASTKSLEAHGFHCEFLGAGSNQRILFNDGGVAFTGAVIGIDGSSLLLPKQRLQWSTKRKQGPKINDRLQANFTKGQTSMDVSAVLVEGCDGMPENCERWVYATSITVKHNGAVKTLKGNSKCGA